MLSRKLLKGLLVSLLLLCSAHIWAYDFDVDNIQYTITSFDDMTVEVSGLTDTDVTEVIIPETVEYRERTLTVTSIASKVFQSNETLETACISNTVTSIGTYAFDGCTALKKVSIGDGVTSIGSYTFRNCSSLPSVIIPNSVSSIESYAFYNCSSLTSLSIGTSVTSIGNYAFYSCSSLTEVTIPNSVTRIGQYAFYMCTNLTKLNIDNSVTSIGSYAFYNCSSLVEAKMGNSVTSIGDYAFYGCSSLAEVTIPDAVTSIGDYAFYGCSSLAEVTIPDAVTSIGDYAFAHCSNLEQVTIGDSVISIGEYVFYYCSLLKELNIPNSVISFGDMTLYGCTSLESLTIGAGLELLRESWNYVYVFSSDDYYISSYCPLLYSYGPTQMKRIIINDGSSSFSMTCSGIKSGLYSPITNQFPIFSNIDIKYFYVGRPLKDIKSWSFSQRLASWLTCEITCNVEVEQPYGTIETLEIGGYCTEVPYFYQSIENLILDKNVMTYEVENIYQGDLKNIVCESATPPTLVGTFDNSTYLDVVLSVPVGYKEFYQSAEGWRNFWTIQEVVISGIDSVVNSGEVTEVGRYIVSGQKINTPQKGINIVRYSDGTARKILVQ